MKMLFVDPASEVNVNVPNLGLAYAATHFGVPVVDQHILSHPKNRFLKQKAEVLGISVRSFDHREAQRIARLYKEKFPRAKVKSISGFLDVQCCYPYLKLEENIAFDKPFSDDYPFPKYELFDSFNYLQTNWETGFWSYPIMTSQGCPYQCIFCASRNRKWLARSAQNCFEELKQTKEKYRIKSFEILDDAFNIDKNRVLKFCELVKPLKLKWACTNGIRADRFDKEMAKAMSESGCQQVGFGIESSDPEVVKKIKKGETIEQIKEAISVAKKYFPLVGGFFILGLPGSTYEKDLRSLEWAKKEEIRAHFSYYVPFNQNYQSEYIFYGVEAKPLSDKYPQNLQMEVYWKSRMLRRKLYLDEKLPFRVLIYTLKALPKYSLPSWYTHVVRLSTRFTSLLTKGEIS